MMTISAELFFKAFAAANPPNPAPTMIIFGCSIVSSPQPEWPRRAGCLAPQCASVRRAGRVLQRGDTAASTQAVDVLAREAKLLQHLVVMLPNSRRAPGRSFRNTVHLNRTADGPSELLAGSFE